VQYRYRTGTPGTYWFSARVEPVDMPDLDWSNNETSVPMRYKMQKLQRQDSDSHLEASLTG